MQQLPQNFGSFVHTMPPEFFQQMMIDAANYQHQQQMMGYSPQPLGNRISDVNSAGIIVAGGGKDRCRHWPRCQLGARCKFHHPSEICKYYPVSYSI